MGGNESKSEEKTNMKRNRNTENFTAAASFEGSRPGYAFRMGESGLGYYRDHLADAAAKKDAEEKTNMKRNRNTENHKTSAVQAKSRTSEQKKKATRKPEESSFAPTSQKTSNIFPFIGQSEEQCVLAFSHLHGNEHVPPMLVRMLTFLRSSLQGNLITSVEADAESAHQFKSPLDVVVLNDGRTIVCDTADPFLFLFTAGGVHTHTLTRGEGTLLGQFHSCSGVVQLSSGRIVATDCKNNRLQSFSLPDGAKAEAVYHHEVSIPPKVAKMTELAHLAEIEPEVVCCVDGVAKALYIVDFFGTEVSAIPVIRQRVTPNSHTNEWSPQSVAYLPKLDLLAVCQYLDNSVWLMRTDGTCVSILKKLSFGPNAMSALPAEKALWGQFVKTEELAYPSSLAVLRDGRVVVCDQGNQRLIVLDPETQEVTLVVDTSQAKYGIKSLRGVSIVPSTSGIVVADQYGKKLHYFV